MHVSQKVDVRDILDFDYNVIPQIVNMVLVPLSLWVTLACRLDFRRLPGPVFDPPRKETAGRVTR